MRLEAHLRKEGQLSSPKDVEDAARRGAQLIEVDIQATADMHLLLYHHYTLPDGRWVAETPFRECLDALGATVGAAALTDLLSAARENGVGVNLDIKSGVGTEHQAHRLLAGVLRETPPDWCEVHASDWDHRGLALLKQTVPYVTVRGALRGRPQDLVAIAQRSGLDGLNLAWDCTRASDVEALHNAARLVCFFGGWGDRYLPYASELGVDIVLVD